MADAKIRGVFRTVVFENAMRTCEYCKISEEYSVQPFVVDHIIPISKGGTDSLENLACACGGCNSYKHMYTVGIDLTEGVTTRLFHPRNDKWSEHFAWNPDFSLIIGVTAIGRATIETLRINRLGLINIRKLLITAGQFPPQY
ncbi:MAG: HNH endonuclease [Saprospiraceae bacterium]